MTVSVTFFTYQIQRASFYPKRIVQLICQGVCVQGFRNHRHRRVIVAASWHGVESVATTPTHVLTAFALVLWQPLPPQKNKPSRTPIDTTRQHLVLFPRMCKSYEGYVAVTHDDDGGDGKIVSVSFVDVHAKGSKVATLGPVSSLAPGAGRKTFVAACEHAEKLGFSTLVRVLTVRVGGTLRPSIDVALESALRVMIYPSKWPAVP